MRNNFDYLIEQFKHAKGIKKADIFSKSFINEFANWIHDRQLIGEEFVSFLDYLNLSFEDEYCAEIGKGERDTLVKPYDTKIISPFADNITEVEDDRLITANFKVYNNNACLLTDKKLVVIPNSFISTYLIQNPYSFSNLEGLENLHNNDTHNIIFGLYGYCGDKDKTKKLAALASFRSKLDGDYISDYDTYEGAYYYVVASNPVKSRFLGRGRQ